MTMTRTRSRQPQGGSGESRPVGEVYASPAPAAAVTRSVGPRIRLHYRATRTISNSNRSAGRKESSVSPDRNPGDVCVTAGFATPQEPEEIPLT